MSEHLPPNVRRCVHVGVKLLYPDAKMPTKGSTWAAGLDLYAYLESQITIPVGTWRAIPTGIAVVIPPERVGLVCPRNGIALGVTVLNAPSVIDEDFHGEVHVILINHGQTRAIVKRGDRIAQLVVVSALPVMTELIDELPPTDRGAGGIGSSGR